MGNGETILISIDVHGHMVSSFLHCFCLGVNTFPATVWSGECQASRPFVHERASERGPEHPGTMGRRVYQDPHTHVLGVYQCLPFVIYAIFTNLRNFSVMITVMIRSYESNPSRHHLNQSLVQSVISDWFHHWSISKLLNSENTNKNSSVWMLETRVGQDSSPSGRFWAWPSKAEWSEPMRWTPWCMKILVGFKTYGGMVASQFALFHVP